ncbi:MULTISPECIES: drug/metabolite exporter YedA [unclassified Undibacterium]|uniref:drug/metabolite exporter YedA n=1 Tax=unclassified Undibacterium TaxID=2630295 RepID=UPI002AC9680D|nr:MULTISPECIES: drug/metabolite exporter YedA [unclassified Undibacterium]MEB0141181.1 drug/metabolite exporter YedA [Undibacterium sp. CCC2.1]MEB0173468.1 drug/metabolite exporter YedA [Undibacterium sp. CCC1.1]MEB0178162.1 drug/metabolite exporter YedA [Undibacterium sp. CCC3.4]MEB0217367.1 drug/metabolite exporter YedA [Undibacterium sp. 5I2]WPX44646.1 drug/metabolite exporter YedA [Undibacterium sp. CCC3.4]
MRHLPKSVLFALLTVYIVWGSTYFAIGLALTSFPPFMMIGTRFLAAGAILYAWQTWRGARHPSLREWRDGGLIGILMLGGGTGLTACAEQYVSSGLTAVFIACSPLILSGLSGLFGDWPKRREWLGIGCGFAGAMLLASDGDFAARPIGIVLLLGAILSWDIGSVLSQKKLRMAPGGMGFASEMLVGGVFLIVLSRLTGETAPGPFNLTALAAWWYLVTAGSLLAFTAYMFLLSKVSTGLASSYAYVNPVIAVSLGAAFGGEQISSRALLAMAIILASVIMLTTAAARGKARTE